MAKVAVKQNLLSAPQADKRFEAYLAFIEHRGLEAAIYMSLTKMGSGQSVLSIFHSPGSVGGTT